MASMKVRASISATQASYIPLATFSSPSEMSLCWKANWTKADEVHTYSTHMTHFIPKVQHRYQSATDGSTCSACTHHPTHLSIRLVLNFGVNPPIANSYSASTNQIIALYPSTVYVCTYVVTPYIRTYVCICSMDHLPLCTCTLCSVWCIELTDSLQVLSIQ